MGYSTTTVDPGPGLFKYPSGYSCPVKVPASRDLRPCRAGREAVELRDGGDPETTATARRYSVAALTTSSSDSSTSAAAGPSGTKLSRLVTREIRPR